MKRWMDNGSVYVAPSKFGAGLFASRDFKKGETVTDQGRTDYYYYPKTLLGSLNMAQQKLMVDFFAETGTTFYVPKVYPFFIHYVYFKNHSPKPNAVYGGILKVELNATKNISAGEEICSDYNSFCPDSICYGLIKSSLRLKEPKDPHSSVRFSIRPMFVEDKLRIVSTMPLKKGQQFYPQKGSIPRLEDRDCGFMAHSLIKGALEQNNVCLIGGFKALKNIKPGEVLSAER